MALPLYLAMTAAELSSGRHIPQQTAWMACHFSPYSEGLNNIPAALPEGAMLILNDRFPCQGHSPDLVAQQLSDAVKTLRADSVLLDFQRPPEPEAAAMVRSILASLPCPAAVSEGYAAGSDCPVFLSPAPLHVPLGEHLSPWAGRQIWLEAALCQEDILVTPQGAACVPRFPPERLEGGFEDETLCCRYRTSITENEVRFTLFDTRQTLEKKLEQAQSLGITRAVGLYQELAV